ncbi:MAG: WbqC family protein [Candidatus Omnitrophota bacterium]
MIVAVHQPNFMPWLGYFYKMYKATMFIFLDDVQFIRRGYTGRVGIKTPKGESWLTVPVIKKGRYHQLIKDVELEAYPYWREKILDTLQACYGKSPYFKFYFPQLKFIMQRDYHLLVDLNIEIIQWMAAILGIQEPIIKSSQIPALTGQPNIGEGTDRLIYICKVFGASTYLSGFGGINYQEQEAFDAHRIELRISDFEHPQYPQMWGRFIPGLSAIDLLFNYGPDSEDIIKFYSGPEED